MSLAAQISDPVTHQLTPCLLLDLGMGGARVRCSASFEVGDQTELTLTAPTLWEPLSMPLFVAWVHSEPEGRVVMGLKFQPNSGMQQLILAELLRDHDKY
jgi:hypothetical protein